MGAQKPSILLIISGGIAAYKCLELIRELKRRDLGVTVVLTKAAEEFVTPLSCAALSGEKVYRSLFDLTDETEMGHIQLSRAHDLICVAPMTADLMAKMAGGQANDLASTLLLASDKPIYIAPSMNVKMWEHPATKRNVATLKQDGVSFIGPCEGDMACGEYGMGRMVEVETIASTLQDALKKNTKIDALPATSGSLLKGRNVLITAGPTHEPIDPVRYIANHSSGKQGYALAKAALDLGANVTLVSGPVQLTPPPKATTIKITTAQQMYEAVHKAISNTAFDIAICAAAVADWKVTNQPDQKLKKQKGALPQLSFEENPDILASLGALKGQRPRLLIGFAAETENIIAHGQTKRKKKQADWIVANDVSKETGTFGGDHNQIHIISGDGVKSYPKMSKDKAAHHIVNLASAYLLQRTKAT